MSALRWIAGLAASLAAHAVAGVILLRALEPQTVPQQPMPESELEVAAYTLERSEARVAPPDPDPAAQEAASGDRLATGAIPASRAKTTEPEAARMAAARPDPGTLAPAATPADRLSERTDKATALPAAAARPTAAPETDASVQNIASATPDPVQAQTAALAAQPVGAGAVTSPKLTAQAPPAVEAPVTPPSVVAAASAVPSAVVAQAAAPASETVNETRPAVRLAALAQPVVDSARPTATDAAPLAELAPRPVAAPAATPRPASASAAAIPTVAANPSRLAASPAAPAVPNALPAQQTVPRSAPAIAAQPDAAPIRAALAFPAGEEGAVDPVSFAAFQSFMQPGDLSVGTDPVRDGVAGILAQVPCSRLQVGFDPETTTLVVNGHIPDGDLRGSVVEALQAQMGTSIKVSDNMLVLPRPQCGALAGIASVGLAQSTDQFTNPRVIGEDTQARVFRFTEGQLLSLDMTAPDYDAVIYLDYFDADGNVLHLEPNEYAPLRRATAKTAQQIGARQAGDEGLRLVIGPPYGQEIAVAFAASHPLYDGLRPIQEPAGPYLDWLRERVTQTRAAYPDFKGEWVYFFVSTSPG